MLQAKTTLMVSLAWMVFNMLPGLLLLHYSLVGRGVTLKIACQCVLLRTNMRHKGLGTCAEGSRGHAELQHAIQNHWFQSQCDLSLQAGVLYLYPGQLCGAGLHLAAVPPQPGLPERHGRCDHILPGRLAISALLIVELMLHSYML